MTEAIATFELLLTIWVVAVSALTKGHRAIIEQCHQDSANEALKFFDWGYKHGQKIAANLDYVPMPDAVVVSLIETTWNGIKGPDGKPLF